MKTEVREQEWTPGLWKILDAVAKEMKKMEAESFDKEEDVYSDPECLLQDPLTGSALFFSPAHDNDAGAPMPMWALMRQGFIVSIRRQPGRVIDDRGRPLKD